MCLCMHVMYACAYVRMYVCMYVRMRAFWAALSLRTGFRSLGFIGSQNARGPYGVHFSGSVASIEGSGFQVFGLGKILDGLAVAH